MGVQFFDNRASLVSWDPSIVMPGSLVEIFSSNHACHSARPMNQVRDRTAGNILFMRIASPAHVIRPFLSVVLSCSLHVKALEFAPFVVLV